MAEENKVTNKGDEENPEYRSRLVAKEIKKDKREDLFAATPPHEANKSIFALAARTDRAAHGDMNKLVFIDVRRAYFNAIAVRDV